jgi:hypothetical protein
MGGLSPARVESLDLIIYRSVSYTRKERREVNRARSSLPSYNLLFPHYSAVPCMCALSLLDQLLFPFRVRRSYPS